MHVVVELGFDSQSERTVGELWNRLSREYGGPQLTPGGARPHLSLASFDGEEPPLLRAEIETLARSFRPFPLRLASIATFPGTEGVVYLAPATSKALLRLHETFHAALAAQGTSGHELYRPGSWVPHCTVAVGVTADRCDAVVALGRRATPIEAMARSIRATSYSPRRELYELDLGEDAASVVGIDHVQLAMPPGREDEARKFYAELLGVDEVAKPAALAARGGAWFESGQVKIHLGVEADFRPAKKAHPALLVVGLGELAARLRAAGYSVSDADRQAGVERVYVEDPFGNRLELLGQR